MPRLATYLDLARRSEQTLARSLRAVSDGHAQHPDVHFTCRLLADMSDTHLLDLAPLVQRYGEANDEDEPERLHATGLGGVRTGSLGLVRDLQDLHLLATLVQTTWTIVSQGAQGLHDRELLNVATSANAETSRQLAWFNTRMKAAAPQALIVS